MNEIEAKIAVSIHYGGIVESKQDVTDFIKLLYPNNKDAILMR